MIEGVQKITGTVVPALGAITSCRALTEDKALRDQLFFNSREIF